LADPLKYENLFPGYDKALEAEKQRDGASQNGVVVPEQQDDLKDVLAESELKSLNGTVTDQEEEEHENSSGEQLSAEDEEVEDKES